MVRIFRRSRVANSYLPAPIPVPSASLLAHAVRPGIHALRKLAGFGSPDILTAATDQCVLAMGTPVAVRKAKFLPGQLERIRGAEFGTVQEVVRDFLGGFETQQLSTTAFHLKDVAVIGGVLYAGKAARHLKPGARRLSAWLQASATPQAALYESWLGNRWFGNWLSDDCLTYQLASFYGHPVTTQSAAGHQIEYERELGMTATRVADTWFDELILFDDRSHNESKRFRAIDLRRRLVRNEPDRHSGTFLLRGRSGDRRELTNEREIAERLARRRGYRVVDPSVTPLAEIIEACAGAQVIAGVEGSHLVHGLMVMPPEGRLLAIQPPKRAVSVLKLITDRQGQDYSFVVGCPGEEPSSFSADADEIERTLDLA